MFSSSKLETLQNVVGQVLFAVVILKIEYNILNKFVLISFLVELIIW